MKYFYVKKRILCLKFCNQELKGKSFTLLVHVTAQLHRLPRSDDRGRVPAEDGHRLGALSPRHPRHGGSGGVHGHEGTGSNPIKARENFKTILKGAHLFIHGYNVYTKDSSVINLIMGAGFVMPLYRLHQLGHRASSTLELISSMTQSICTYVINLLLNCSNRSLEYSSVGRFFL